MKGRTLAVLALSAALAAAPLAACGRGAESAPPAGGGIPMRPAPPPSLWDRALARLVPATFYGEVVSSGEGGARYELECSMTTSYVLRSLFLDFKRYEGKRVVVRGYVRGADGRGKPMLWAVRVTLLDRT